MAKRRLSDYSIFVSARMRALAPHSRQEARAAMTQAAAEWRAMKRHRTNPLPISEQDEPFEEEDQVRANPARRRRRYSRRNPGGGSKLLPLAIAAAALWYFFGKKKAAAV